MGSQSPGLPVEFVTAVAAQATATSAAALFAADQAHGMEESSDRERLLWALVTTPFRKSAPPWLLEAAVSQGLNGGNDRWAGSGIDLAASALAHPCCTDAARNVALQRCTEIQLASLGTARRPATVSDAVAAELRRRSSDPVPMTRELLTQPTPAQLVLRTERLADAVFDAAFALLPTQPEQPSDSDTDDEDWYKRFTDQLDAWTAMWKTVLEHHPDRHASIVERTEGGPGNYRIRHHLLGTMPWTVEPALLKSVALADLEHFQVAVLTTQLCRALRDGLSRDAAQERFADRIKALVKGGTLESAGNLDRWRFSEIRLTGK